MTSQRNFFYQDAALAYSPQCPIPGDEDAGQLSGLDWPSHPLPEYMGQTFTKACQFWTIARQIAVGYFGTQDNVRPTVPSLAFAEAKYQELLRWADSLPSEMTPNGAQCAHVLILQLVVPTESLLQIAYVSPALFSTLRSLSCSAHLYRAKSLTCFVRFILRTAHRVLCPRHH